MSVGGEQSGGATTKKLKRPRHPESWDLFEAAMWVVAGRTYVRLVKALSHTA